MKTQLVAYVDESSTRRITDHQEYMVCAALVDAKDVDTIRTQLCPLRLPGQVKLHWTDERDSRRRKIIETLTSINSMHVIITHRSSPNRKTERFRRKCLEQLYYQLSDMQIQDITLESRQEAQNKKDKEHIVALQGQSQCTDIHIKHVRGGDDPLLWIPDAVLGALNSMRLGDDQFWEPIRDKVLFNQETPDSLPLATDP